MTCFTCRCNSDDTSSVFQGARLSGNSNGEANNAHATFSLSAVLKHATVAIRAAALALLLGIMALPVAAQTGPAKFIPTFLIYYGGGPALVASDAAKLAKFDLLDMDRYRYDAIGPNTWAAIKAINPNVEIYLYEMGAETPTHLDGMAQVYLNGLGRHNVARGHPMGSLNGNQPGLFLLDSAGKRIYNVTYSNVGANQYWYLMDFGSVAYQSYWINAVKTDIIDKPWVADGIHADNCLTLANAGGYSATPQWYSTNASWSANMNSFASAITAGMHGYGQKLWCNRGETRFADGSAAWQSLDNSANPPDVLLEEGAFAVEWGPWAVQFYQESEWKREIDTMGAIRNSKVAMLSHTKLLDGQSGTDNYGKPVTYSQTLWYALGSFLLAKNDVLNNSYFMFHGGNDYNQIWWHDEYDKIDLGKAVGSYSVATVGSTRVYWREFEKGYVYVNPTTIDAVSVTLPQASRQLTRNNLFAALDSIPSINSIALPSHNSAILLKTVATTPEVDTQRPSVPTGLTGTAVSSTQINLSWNASTDNVGVTGYEVFRNDVRLTATTTTSFQNTGLAAGTTYNYRVQAFDAGSNYSGWSAAPVSVTTTVSTPDTTKPSVPTGLTGTAVSASQISLSWNASTDNVRVTGYRVYRNGTQIATTTTTSFQDTGRAAGRTFKYRVSAYDAVPNNSAWTTPVQVTTRN